MPDLAFPIYFSEPNHFYYEIKPNHKPTKLRGKIVASSNQADDLFAMEARQLAAYGKPLSDHNLFIERLLKAKWRFKMSKPAAHFPVPPMSQEEKTFLYWKELVSEIFINAVLNHDRKTIIELADAAAFFKGKVGEPGVDFEPADPVMHKLLKIKWQPRAFPKKFTMRQIAEMVYTPKMIKQHEADGFSALRAQCKKLGIPIIPAKRGRK